MSFFVTLFNSILTLVKFSRQHFQMHYFTGATSYPADGMDRITKEDIYRDKPKAICPTNLTLFRPYLMSVYYSKTCVKWPLK